MPIAIFILVVVLFSSIIAYISTPKKLVFGASLTIYYLMCASIILLIISDKSIPSPYIIVWALISSAASIFGLYGIVPILLSSGAYTIIKYLNNEASVTIISAIIISSVVPLIIGSIIWREKSSRDEIDDENRAYKNLTTELNEMANKSEVVVNAIGDGVVVVDGKGTIQLINPAAQQIIGWGRQDALTLNYRSVLQIANQKNELVSPNDNPIQQVLNNNQQVRTNDLVLITKSDKKIMISLVVSPVGDIGSGVIAVFHDITKEKTEERQQAEFISTASHEMRTPVAAIEGYLGLALNPQTAQIDERARNFINKAHESADHLGHLFQDLLDVSKADDGRIGNNPKVVDIVNFVNDITQSLMPKANEKGIRLTFKPTSGISRERHITPVYYVNLDNNHIREIASNLIENAIKYTPSGEVIVDVSGNDDNVVFSIKDSGVGIPAEDMPHLFQKFYRVENKSTSDIGGTGLGLYICRRLAEIMGGRIWAESVYGKGSTFNVELPRISNLDATELMKKQAQNAKDEQERLMAKQAEERQLAQQNVVSETPVINRQTANAVPRSQSLTPEQIAAYVAKQRALARQQTELNQPQKPVQPAPQPAPIPMPQQAPVEQPIQIPQTMRYIPPPPVPPKQTRPSVIPIEQIELTNRQQRVAPNGRPVTMQPVMATYRQPNVSVPNRQ